MPTPTQLDNIIIISYIYNLWSFQLAKLRRHLCPSVCLSVCSSFHVIILLLSTDVTRRVNKWWVYPSTGPRWYVWTTFFDALSNTTIEKYPIFYNWSKITRQGRCCFLLDYAPLLVRLFYNCNCSMVFGTPFTASSDLHNLFMHHGTLNSIQSNHISMPQSIFHSIPVGYIHQNIRQQEFPVEVYSFSDC